jgi:hypothetical protein
MLLKTRPGNAAPRTAASTMMGGLVWQKVAGVLGMTRSAEQQDLEAANRGLRLERLVKGLTVDSFGTAENPKNVWTEDILPLFYDTYDQTLAAVENGEADVSALRSLKLFMANLQTKIDLGAGAAARMADSRLRGLTAAALSAEEKNPAKAS